MADIGFDHIGHSDGTGHDQLHGVIEISRDDNPARGKKKARIRMDASLLMFMSECI